MRFARWTLYAMRSSPHILIFTNTFFFHISIAFYQNRQRLLSQIRGVRRHFFYDFLVNFFDLSNIIYAFHFLIQFPAIQLSDVEVKIDVVIQGFVEPRQLYDW